MLTKKRLPLLIACIFGLEVLIYGWAAWTSTFEPSNFFAIEPAFVFDKCARIAGRVSAALILITILMVGYYGLFAIYRDEKKRDAFRILITLFTLNHLIHFIYVIIRIKSHGTTLSIAENMHGFLTFLCIVLIPVLLWSYATLPRLLYLATILHLFNISYFMNKTFLGKVKPEDPAYHNQLGIVVLSAACIYIVCSMYRENRQSIA
jgi:hypothetical protein